MWIPDEQWRVICVERLDQEGLLERRHLRELRGARNDQTRIRHRTTHKWSRSRAGMIK
jgi:hypothetical protein